MRNFFNGKRRATKKQIKFITREINNLPVHEQPLIHLYFWEECSISEIAFICDLPQSLIQEIFNESIHRLRLNYLIEFSIPQKNRGFM